MNWIVSTPNSMLMSAFSATAIFIAVIALTRISGLRSFSKLSAFDFAVTVAIGSIIATTVTSSEPPLMLSFTSLSALYLLQIVTAWLRVHFRPICSMLDNKPLLLMDGENIIHQNLKIGKITVDDIYAKLREANVIEWSEIKAVVLESTGDVSVLHGDCGAVLDGRLMKGLRR